MNSNTKMFLAGLAVGVLLAVSWYYFKGGATEKFEEKKPEEAPKPQEPKKPQLVLFYMNGCHHCQMLMPTWAKLEEMLAQGGPVEPVKIELSEPAAQGHNVRGAPTIRLYTEGLTGLKYAEYKGDRSLEDIVRFISQPTA